MPLPNHFPVTCVDNFFDDPLRVREFALSLEMSPSLDGRWPGTRTAKLHEVAPDYFNFFCNKLFSTFYDFRKQRVDWVVETTFQLITPYEAEDVLSEKINQGWVHKDDDAILAGVVYLTPNASIESGTSLFRAKDGTSCINLEDKKAFYLGETSANAEYAQKLDENNSQFEETLSIGNVFNRLACYDGDYYHKANTFLSKEPRLTQVFFVRRIETDWLPASSCRGVQWN